LIEDTLGDCTDADTKDCTEDCTEEQCEESETHDQVLVMSHEVEDHPVECTDGTAEAIDEHGEAIFSLLTDSGVDTAKWNPKTAKSLIKSLQPFQEMPSKDWRKRFTAGSIFGDVGKPINHDVALFDFWAISITKLQHAWCFLIGQILYMYHLNKTCSSERRSNPNVEVLFEEYGFDPAISSYSRHGRSGFLKASKSLIANISEEVVLNDEDIKFNYQKIPVLKDYVTYHQDIDLDSRLPKENPPTICPEDTNEDPFIVDKDINKRFNERKVQYEF